MEKKCIPSLDGYCSVHHKYCDESQPEFYDKYIALSVFEMTREEEFIEALEKIAEYDVENEHGNVDEWTEAEAFNKCKEIAKNVLGKSRYSGNE